MRLWSSNRSRSILSNPFKTEHRASATDAIVNALITQASGGGSAPSSGDLAAVEAAAGLWSRAFASATVEPDHPHHFGALSVNPSRHRARSGCSR